MAEAKNVLVLKHFEAPKAPGQHFRLLCMTGKNKGESYFITGKRIVIGRSEKADVIITDAKSSREHAEITKVGANYILTDLKSQNGIYVNESRINQQTLKDGDKIIIGQTVFRFGRVEVLDQPTQTSEPVSQSDFDRTINSEGPESTPKKKSKSSLLIIGILAIAAFILMEDDPATTSSVSKKKNNIIVNEFTDDMESELKKKQIAEDKELKEKLDAIFHRGLREVREGNYYRAINEFNLALILSPKNARASFYRDRTIQMLDAAIEESFISARRHYDALKYRSSANSYCSIVRLIQNNPDDQRYKDAMANIKEIEKILGLNNGEIVCISQ